MFDVLTIAAVADEVRDTLLDGRVQRIGLLDPLTFAAEVYAGGRRRMLVASADNQRARLHLTESAASFDPHLVTPFGLLLRKYVRGGVLVAVEQPPLERLVRLSIAKRLTPHNASRPRADDRDDLIHPDDDDLEFAPPDEEGEFEATYVHLAIELMGRHSNLILIDDAGRIMDSAKRVTAAMSRVRPVLPRMPYVSPPPIAKPDPRRMTAVDVGRLLAAQPATTDLAKLLVREYRAMSPRMAREIAFRVGGDAAVSVGDLTNEQGAADLARETRALLEPLVTSAWSPRVYRDLEDGSVVAFAPLPMGHLAAESTEEVVASISLAADLDEEAQGPGTPVAHAQRRERLARSIGDARDRLQGRLASLRTEGAKAGEIERLREWGELIYGYLWQMLPGQQTLEVDGVKVPLDPALSAKENAQAYFERYRKAQGAGAHVPELIERTEHEVAYLDQLLQLTSQARGFAEVEALTAEWTAHQGPGADRESKGGKPQSRKSAAPKRPKPLLDRRGNAVYIGRSGRENDLVTFGIADQDDTWLHARGVPGSHVIVRWHQPGAAEDPDTLAAAAALAAHYSAARSSATVEVDATKRRHVRKIKGAGPGMVTYRNERTLAVHPADEAALGQVFGGRTTEQTPG